MKNSDAIWLAVAAGVAYYLYTKSQTPTAPNLSQLTPAQAASVAQANADAASVGLQF